MLPALRAGMAQHKMRAGTGPRKTPLRECWASGLSLQTDGHHAQQNCKRDQAHPDHQITKLIPVNRIRSLPKLRSQTAMPGPDIALLETFGAMSFIESIISILTIICIILSIIIVITIVVIITMVAPAEAKRKFGNDQHHEPEGHSRS